MNKLTRLAVSVRMDFRIKREKVQVWIAFQVPRWLVYWCSIRLMADATTGKYRSVEPSQVNIMDALEAWKA